VSCLSVVESHASRAFQIADGTSSILATFSDALGDILKQGHWHNLNWMFGGPGDGPIRRGAPGHPLTLSSELAAAFLEPLIRFALVDPYPAFFIPMVDGALDFMLENAGLRE
jgi:hypothetical protein